MGIRLDYDNIVSDKEAVMHIRPLSVSIVGWLVSIGGVLGILSSLKVVFLTDDSHLLTAPQHTTISAVVELVLSVVIFVCGVNILNGANWARWLYTGICVCLFILDLLATFVASGRPGHLALFALVRGTVVHGTAIILLFLPDSDDFFTST
jgi:hypothetical protein